LSIGEIAKEVSNPKIPNIFIHVKGGEISPINRLIQLPSYAKEIPDLQANLTIEEMSDQIEKPSKTVIPGGLAEKVIKPAKSVFAIADEKDALTKSFRTYMSEVPSNRVILVGRAKLTDEELATILQFLEGTSLTIEQVNATAKEITKLREK
jgi:hemolysin activation/secretion protein